MPAPTSLLHAANVVARSLVSLFGSTAVNIFRECA
jgi:hypothetical protein